MRCIGYGPQTYLVKYDPNVPLHDRYTMVPRDEFVTPEEASILEDTCLTINAFFGWDFNSCESLRKTGEGTWYPIDFANPCPDSQVTSLHFHFPWMVKAYLRWTLFNAATKRPMRKTLDWEPRRINSAICYLERAGAIETRHALASAPWRAVQLIKTDRTLRFARNNA